MKTCKRCGAMKALDDFYTHFQMRDGHLNVCKECIKTGVRAWYRDTREARAKYERERFQKPERKAAALRYQRAARKRSPEKKAARQAVGNAIRAGRLERLPCAVCGSTVRVQAHHHDYSKPLDVEWLCFRHHREDRHDQQVVGAA